MSIKRFADAHEDKFKRSIVLKVSRGGVKYYIHHMH